MACERTATKVGIVAAALVDQFPEVEDRFRFLSPALKIAAVFTERKAKGEVHPDRRRRVPFNSSHSQVAISVRVQRAPTRGGTSCGADLPRVHLATAIPLYGCCAPDQSMATNVSNFGRLIAVRRFTD